MKPIERKIETLQDIAAEICGVLQAIQVARDTADVEISGEGLTQATCEQVANLMAQLHVHTARLHNGGHSVHQSISRFLPPGANEGPKPPWPSYP